jgi:hypothetical protein
MYGRWRIRKELRRKEEKSLSCGVTEMEGIVVIILPERRYMQK